MALLVPEILHSYLLLFRPHFTKPSFVYFSGYILSLLLTGGRKTMNRVAKPVFLLNAIYPVGNVFWLKISGTPLP